VLNHEELALLLGGIDLADTQRRQAETLNKTSAPTNLFLQLGF